MHIYFTNLALPKITIGLNPNLSCRALIPRVGVGGTPIYGLYRYVQPQRVGFFSRFGHKQGINFGHFGYK